MTPLFPFYEPHSFEPQHDPFSEILDEYQPVSVFDSSSHNFSSGCSGNTHNCITDLDASVPDIVSDGDLPLQPQSAEMPQLAAVPSEPFRSSAPSLGALPVDHQHEIVTAILDSGAGLCTFSEELARRKGLQLTPSSHLARLGDGSLVKSAGSTDVVFVFQNMLNRSSTFFNRFSIVMPK